MNRALLNTYLRNNEHRQYAFGDWDCTEFVFGHVLAQTGTDHFTAYRGRYSDYEQGVRLMKEIDRVATVRGLVTARLGDPVPVAFARTGDIVSFENIVGILYGERGIFLAEHHGYERVSRRVLDRAWHIGI